MRSHRLRRATRLPPAMITFAFLTALSIVRAGAEETSSPQVVSAQSLPKDCKALGEVTGKHMETAPREEEAQRYAIDEAKRLGATHVVTVNIYACGGFEICYEGKAYRCPAASAPAQGK